MIGDVLQPTHLIFILVVALLVLGPKRLPEVGRSLGKGLRDFRNAVSGDALLGGDHSESESQPDPGVTPSPVTPATTSITPEESAEHTVTPLDVTNPVTPSPVRTEGSATAHDAPADVVDEEHDHSAPGHAATTSGSTTDAP